jgi:hypothetical protein
MRRLSQEEIEAIIRPQNTPQVRATATPSVGGGGLIARGRLFPSGSLQDPVLNALASRCAFQYNQLIPESGDRGWSAERVRCRLEGTELRPFQRDLERVLAHQSVATFVDLLRLEVVTELKHSLEALTGRSVDRLPSGCDHLRPSAPETRSATSAFSRSQSADFLQEYRQAARMALPVIQELLTLQQIPRTISCQAEVETQPRGTSSSCSNPRYEETQTRRQQLQRQFDSMMTQFPLLDSPREHGRVSDLDLSTLRALAAAATSDSQARLLLNQSQARAAERTNAALREVCSGQVTDAELLRLEGPVQRVQSLFPEFSELGRCMRTTQSPLENLSASLHTVISLGCLGLAFTGAGSAPCMSYFVAASGTHFLRDWRYTQWTANCLAAHSGSPTTVGVCSQEDYRAAADSLQQATAELMVSAAPALFEAGTAASQALSRIQRLVAHSETPLLQATARRLRSLGTQASDEITTAVLQQIEADLSRGVMARGFNFSRIPEADRGNLQSRIHELLSLGVRPEQILERIPCLRP